MPASYPRLPVELLRRIFDEVIRGEDAAEPEDLGRVVARVCRDWKDVGQELAFRRPVLWGYYRSKAVPALVRHLQAFPHLAAYVRELILGKQAEAKDCSIELLHDLLRICPGVTHVNWGFDKPDLLQAIFPHIPFTNLTSLSISCGEIWNPSPLLAILPNCARLRRLHLSVSLESSFFSPNRAFSAMNTPRLALDDVSLRVSRHSYTRGYGNELCAPETEAICLQRFLRLVDPASLTSLGITCQPPNIVGVAKWIARCVNLLSLNLHVATGLNMERSCHIETYTRMLRSLVRLETFALFGDLHTMHSGDDSARDQALLSAFLDALLDSLVEFHPGFEIPLGACYEILAACLGSRLIASPLLRVEFWTTLRKEGFVNVTATKQVLLIEDYDDYDEEDEEHGYVEIFHEWEEAGRADAKDLADDLADVLRMLPDESIVAGRRWCMSFDNVEGTCSWCMTGDAGWWVLGGEGAHKYELEASDAEAEEEESEWESEEESEEED